MIKDMIAALIAGGNPVLIAAKFQSDFNQEVIREVVEPDVVKPPIRLGSDYRSRYHIKRDGRTLCQLKNTYGVSWNQAIKKSDLSGCCAECQRVFYTRLSRTLTVI